MTTGERIKDCVRHLVYGMLGALMVLCFFMPRYTDTQRNLQLLSDEILRINGKIIVLDKIENEISEITRNIRENESRVQELRKDLTTINKQIEELKLKKDTILDRSDKGKDKIRKEIDDLSLSVDILDKKDNLCFYLIISLMYKHLGIKIPAEVKKGFRDELEYLLEKEEKLTGKKYAKKDLIDRYYEFFKE